MAHAAALLPRGALTARRHTVRWTAAAGAVLLAAVVAGLTIGPVSLPVGGIVRELLDRLPLVHVDSGLTDLQRATVWEIRAPRVVIGALVGSMLSVSGASYQGAFRNPLADPYLLGVAAGAGLGATVAIVAGAGTGGAVLSPVPLAAFAGALASVVLTYLVGGVGRRASATSLVLAGVAIASFLTALQTYVQQRNSDVLREVYSWILGRLTVVGWTDVGLVAPYIVVATAVLLAMRRTLDVMAVGDEEASTLGVRVARARLVVVLAASLGTAAAVAVSGLIGFVGIIVPHTVRLMVGGSYRRILPLSMILGAAFLVSTDLLARTVVSPAELPIGVITAMIGAPFFLLVLRTSREGAS
jgi:iron complex transport system permease protein